MEPLGEVLRTLLWGIRQGNDSTLTMGLLGRPLGNKKKIMLLRGEKIFHQTFLERKVHPTPPPSHKSFFFNVSYRGGKILKPISQGNDSHSTNGTSR